MSLNNKRVVIVGGSSGIGLATAQAFLNESAQVSIASRSIEKLEEAKKVLGDSVAIHELDFKDQRQAEAFFHEVGLFDHLVITAGEGSMGHYRELVLEDAQSSFDSKFWGQYITVKAAIPFLNEAGSITLTSGVYGKRPPVGATTLAAINSAIEGLMRGLAVDLAPIRVNVVSPGIVDTPIYAGMPDDQRNALFNSIGNQLPVGRIAQPEDIAATYVYLAKNGFTTGTVIMIEGGALLA